MENSATGSPIDTSLDVQGSTIDFVTQRQTRQNSRSALWEQQMTVQWSQLRVVAKLPKQKTVKGQAPSPTTKIILDGVDGVSTPGTLTALMGASGAGKTTLLNVLNRTGLRNLEVEGEVLVNGLTVSPTTMSRISGFVQQEDLFMGTLRVREHLLFHANLRMKGITKEKKKEKIESVIRSVGLKKCEDSIIGIPGAIKGISGGEAKRLSFACELLTDPMILCCDEPTSGLDAFMAQTVVAVLKTMAASGKTIIATIHQPSSEIFAMFDDLYIMGEGKLCFSGRISDSAVFFAGLGFPCPPNYNLADHLIHTLAIVPGEEEERRKRVQDISDKFRSSVYGKKHQTFLNKTTQDHTFQRKEDKTKMNIRDSYYTGPCNQLKWLLYRHWKRISRDPYYITIKIGEAAALGLFLGVLFFKTKFDELVVRNYAGVLFFVQTDISFDMVYGPLESFPLGIPIMNRDRMTGLYSPSMFYLVQVIGSVIQGFLVVLIRVSILFWMVDFEMKTANDQVGVFFTLFMIYEVLMQVAVAYGYMICCIGGNLSVAMALANPFMIIPLLFAGFFIAKNSIPAALSWMCYTSFFYYGFESISIVLWKKVKDSPTACNDNRTRSSTQVLNAWGYHEENLTLDIVMLFVLLLIYHAVALLSLNLRNRRK